MRIKKVLSPQPIPPDATRVFKGKCFDIYQWKQQLFDDTETIFEKVKAVNTVSIIPVTENGKILISHQQQPGTVSFMSVFGGRIDNDEHPLDAAKRELLEETGYTAKKFILWDATQLLHQIEWTMYTFIAKGCKKVNDPQLDGGEKIKITAISIDEFVSLATKRNFRGIEIALKLFRDKNAMAELKG